jgi:hypothetical protein
VCDHRSSGPRTSRRCPRRGRESSRHRTVRRPGRDAR